MMGMPQLRGHSQALKAFTDVVYLTNKGRMPWEIRKLLRQKSASFLVLPLGDLVSLRENSHLVGTAILDAEDMDPAANAEVARTIEALEMENIGVIVLTHRVDTPVKSFSLTPTRTSFSMLGSVEAVSIDDLWVRISVNLAYRKKSSGIVCKPLVPASQMKIGANKLAEQLQMTAALVENLTEQMQLAGLVQRDFLPTQLPHCDRIRWAATFQPAEWVSGDIYDIAQLEPGQLGFYIVDAVGHGMPAALLTIFVKQAIATREAASPHRVLAPAEVIRQLNARMCRERLSGYQFATCCYCLLDADHMKLTFARAGHPYPILWKPGRDPVQLEVRGSLLGVFEQAEYVEGTVSLERGDRVLLYSDGAEPFIGRFDDQKGFVFHKPFLDLGGLPIGELVDRFTELTRTPKGDSTPVDDITIVGLQVL
jgi:serine phosphatase RsbU (regulator of sigma subunit)